MRLMCPRTSTTQGGGGSWWRAPTSCADGRIEGRGQPGDCALRLGTAPIYP